MKYIQNLSQIDFEDLDFAGVKAANLGEMTTIGLPVPAGFVIGTNAYFKFLKVNNLGRKISQLLLCNLEDPETLMTVSCQIISEIESYLIPEEISAEILQRFENLKLTRVAIKPSTTLGSIRQASAFQQSAFLNVGRSQLLEKIRACWVSAFTPRTIYFQRQNNFDLAKSGLAVIVQTMVKSNVSGVIFTVDPLNYGKNVMVIEAGFGLREPQSLSQVTPDQYKVGKTNLEILAKEIANQKVQLVEVGGKNLEIPVSPKFALSQKLQDWQILELASYGKLAEKHYYFPQEIEWMADSGKIYILQTRPSTILGLDQKLAEENQTFDLKLLLEGCAVSSGIATGWVKKLKDAKEISKISQGDVLLANVTNPEFLLAIKKAAAVVTDDGGKTSHAAIICRQLGKPAVVGTGKATQILEEGLLITVDGTRGKIYAGGPKIIEKRLTRNDQLPTGQEQIKTVTKVFVNLIKPETAAKLSQLNVDGVVILGKESASREIGIDPQLAISEDKRKDLVKKLATNLVTVAENFVSGPVIYRAFGQKIPQVFEIELEAVKEVYRQGFENLKLVVPFTRTVAELGNAKKVVAEKGLYKYSDFGLWMTLAVPSNILSLSQFLEVGVEGISIDFANFTRLILAIDRNDQELAGVFQETEPTVLLTLEKVIKTCKAFGVSSLISGQATAAFDELVNKLVVWGLTSISVSADSLNRIRELVYQTELDLVISGQEQQNQLKGESGKN